MKKQNMLFSFIFYWRYLRYCSR